MSTTNRGTFNPSTIKEEMELILDLYKERINSNPTQDEVEALGEQYRMIQSRNLDGFEWVTEAILVVGKKAATKKNLPYIVGMLRKWAIFGFGYIPMQEEEQVISYIEDDFNITLNSHARHILQELLGKYGSINLTRTISKEGKDIDLSVGIMLAIKNHIETNTDLGGANNDDN